MDKNNLYIALAVVTLGGAFCAYKWQDDRKDIRALHDVLAGLPAGTTSIPIGAIPKDLLVKMNEMH